jgi:hypothetical protein
MTLNKPHEQTSYLLIRSDGTKSFEYRLCNQCDLRELRLDSTTMLPPQLPTDAYDSGHSSFIRHGYG